MLQPKLLTDHLEAYAHGLVDDDSDLIHQLVVHLAAIDRQLLTIAALGDPDLAILIVLRKLVACLYAHFHFLEEADADSRAALDVAGADPAAAATTKLDQGEPS